MTKWNENWNYKTKVNSKYYKTNNWLKLKLKYKIQFKILKNKNIIKMTKVHTKLIKLKLKLK